MFKTQNKSNPAEIIFAARVEIQFQSSTIRPSVTAKRAELRQAKISRRLTGPVAGEGQQHCCYYCI